LAVEQYEQHPDCDLHKIEESAASLGILMQQIGTEVRHYFFEMNFKKQRFDTLKYDKQAHHFICRRRFG